MKLSTMLVCAVVGMSASSAVAWGLGPVELGPVPVSALGALVDEATSEPVAVAAAPEPLAIDGTLNIKGRLGHSVVQADGAQETFLYLNLTAPQDVAAAQTKADIMIVIDRSGSMRGKRMQNALAAARGMITRLRDGDTVTVVTYDKKASLLVAPTVISPETRASITERVRRVRTGGATCISCGLDVAIAQGRGGEQAGVRRLLLLSDGKANRGVKSMSGFREIAARARALEIPISSIGVDIDYNEQVLSALSLGSNGRHYFVERLGALPRIFDEELQAVAGTVASEAQLELELEDGVELVEVMDRESSRSGNRVVVPFGSFSPGQEKTLLVRVRLPAANAGTHPVARVKMRYRDRTSGREAAEQGALAVLVSDKAEPAAELDPVVEARVSQSETVAALANARDLLDAGRDAEAQRALDTTSRRVKKRRTKAQTLAPLDPAPAAALERQWNEIGRARKDVGAAVRAKNTKAAPKKAERLREIANKRNIAASAAFE